MEIETYLTSGDESLRLYRDVTARIRRHRRKDMLITGFFAYIHLPAVLLGLVLLNIGATHVITRLIWSVLIFVIARGVRNGLRYCRSDVVRRESALAVLKDYGRQNAYEILQRARADTSPYGKAIVNAIVGVVRMRSGGYATVTSDITISCVRDRSHVWGMVIDFPLYGQLEYIVYCPACGEMSLVTLDGSRVPESLIPQHMRDQIHALSPAGLLGNAYRPKRLISVRDPYTS